MLHQLRPLKLLIGIADSIIPLGGDAIMVALQADLFARGTPCFWSTTATDHVSCRPSTSEVKKQARLVPTKLVDVPGLVPQHLPREVPQDLREALRDLQRLSSAVVNDRQVSVPTHITGIIEGYD